ncbi:MAG: TIGR04255 family protein, partial [Gammaproteobacteria bacterium]
MALLPEYAKPPVVEVACAVQFEPITELHAGRLGALWGEYRDRYPRVEQHPPLPALREQFEATPARLGFTVETTFPMPRVWFLSAEGTRLVQVQRDYFILNWRKLDTDAVYPRYP